MNVVEEQEDSSSPLSSEDFPSGRFRPHGKFTSIIDERRVIRSVSAGPFNEEMSALADQARRKLFATFGDGQPFAVITEIRGSAMASGPTIDLTARLMKAMRADGVPMPCAMVWLIGDGVEGGALMTPFFERCFADIGLNFRVLNDQASADQWVAEALLNAHRAGADASE